jgi:hypothetical protein
MTRQDLEEHLDRLGGDLSRWPAALRDAAAELAARDAGAARLIAQAARLERTLGDVMAPMPLDAASLGRIVAGAGSRRETPLRLTPRLAALAAAATLVLFLAGFSAGLLAPPGADDGAYAALLFGGDVSGEWL